MRDAETLRVQAESIGVALEPSQVARLLRFEDLLLERAIPLGAVAKSDAGRFRDRHTLDCLRAAPVVEGAQVAADLGSGAGLPGVVVAIALPLVRVLLIERRPKRAAFLEWTVEELGLSNTTVIVGRVEDVTDRVDVGLARAFAPLEEAWRRAEAMLRPGGRLVYFAGAGPSTPPAPSGSTIQRILRTPVLESSGALVIMTRQ